MSGNQDDYASSLDELLDCHCEVRAARAELAALRAERDALRRTLSSARAWIRLILNRDKISEWTTNALREAETEIDAALSGKEGT